ncbi:MAG: putative zinc-binding protein [Syntrophobacterales bacterium]|jgi:uncharacterized metal-binding protein|nr:putative zinc-binding protein [Syntrophobacterales bacterium]
MYEEIKIKKVEDSCQMCEDYAEKHATTPTKAAIMSCEGACARGEVSRRAANLIAYKISPDNTVRICLGGAFTKEGGQRDLVRTTHKAITIEGCFISCASRMMKAVIPELNVLVLDACEIHDEDIPFGINEMTDDEFNRLAKIVAEEVTKEYINK